MLTFYLYETSTGRVLALGAYDERADGAAARSVGVGVINPATQYAPAGVVTARPTFNFATLLLDKAAILANAVDAATVSGIPAGTVARIFKDQDQYPRAAGVINDGTLQLRVDTAGRYLIVLANFPTQEHTFSVVAT